MFGFRPSWPWPAIFLSSLCMLGIAWWVFPIFLCFLAAVAAASAAAAATAAAASTAAAAV